MKIQVAKPGELYSIKHEQMEALLIINSTLVAVCLYFIKDFHKDFKDFCRKVERHEADIRIINHKLEIENREVTSKKEK